MSITARQYRDDQDRERIIRLVTLLAADGARSFLQVGDVVWGMYQNMIFEPREHMRLWHEPDGELAGFAWFDGRSSAQWHVHPRHAGEVALHDEMLVWLEEHRRVSAPSTESEIALYAEIFNDDAPRIALLTRHGYAPTTEHQMVSLWRDLADPIGETAMPAGWTVRQVGEEAEYAERVDMHREVWHPSRVTLESYRRLRTIPGYSADLDLVAVAPDGRFGSYCICWYDPVNHSGEFEPVGTRSAYHQMGLGKAVMQEGLRRLKQRGATIAIVYSMAANAAARALYASVGFGVARTTEVYAKRLRRGAGAEG